MKKYVAIGVGILASVLLTTTALAASYTLFGDALIVSGGNPGNAAQIRSDTVIPPSYGVVSFTVPSTAWSSFNTLSTDYNVTDDSCGGGSPRFQIRVDTNGDGISDGNVHVAIGPSPNFVGCAGGWQSTGNVIGNEDAGRYDFSQFGGSPFTTYSNAPASVVGGNVVGVSLVTDGSWSAAATGGDGEQTVLVDNVNINGTIETFDLPTDKDACKDDGWKTLVNSSNQSFKNQGDCIQFVNTGK